MTTPSPDSCGHCGRDLRDHGVYQTTSAGIHTYIAPTDSQRLERMKKRREEAGK